MNAGSSPIRILAVDDHPLVRQGIAGLIGSSAGYDFGGEASNGREAIQQFRTQHPGRHADGLANAGDERPRCAHCDSQ